MAQMPAKPEFFGDPRKAVERNLWKRLRDAVEPLSDHSLDEIERVAKILDLVSRIPAEDAPEPKPAEVTVQAEMAGE